MIRPLCPSCGHKHEWFKPCDVAQDERVRAKIQRKRQQYKKPKPTRRH